MAIIATKYDSFKLYSHNGTINIASDIFNVMLLLSTYEPDYVNHTVLADIAIHELPDGNGYAAGGEELTNPVIDKDGYDADDPEWLGLGTPTPVLFRYAACYRPGLTNGVQDPLCFCVLLDDTPGDITADNTNFKLQLAAAGLLVFG